MSETDTTVCGKAARTGFREGAGRQRGDLLGNLGFGMDPALGGLPRLFDAFTDPLMGFISDRTKSKWGRRRIYIFWGAIAAGIPHLKDMEYL